MIENLKEDLKKLYNQKEIIQRKIEDLERIIYKKQSNNNLQVIKKFSKEDKINIFKRLFVGRFDLYSKFWLSKDGKRKSFYPVAKTFKGEDYIPIDDCVIEKHLRGEVFLGTYCIDSENFSKFLRILIKEDFIIKFKDFLEKLKINAYYELDKDNNVAAWIFFEKPISTKIVFNFIQFIIFKLKINTYYWPSKEYANRINFPKVIPMPLYLPLRKQNKTIFIDIESLNIIKDQWTYLNNIKRVSAEIIYKYSLNSPMIKNESNFEIDKNSFLKNKIDIVLKDYIYLPIDSLSKQLLFKLKSIASFENPQIKLLINLRKPLFNVPKVLKSFEEDQKYLKLPRGLKEDLFNCFKDNGIEYKIIDKRVKEKYQVKKILFKLRPEQEKAIGQIIKYDYSICVAPPGFGKTLIGAKIFELRASKTLIIVNKNILLDQWIERFIEYFNYKKEEIGYLGKGKNKLTKNIDIATMQSLKNNLDILDNYAFLIIDECHHIPAVTFEQIIKKFKGKYALGLSATPSRKDGLEPILYHQLGKISYEYRSILTHYNQLQIVNTDFVSNTDNFVSLVNELCENKQRNKLIIDIIENNLDRKILLLSDRVEHIKCLQLILEEKQIEYVSIYGSMGKKEQVDNMKKIKNSSLVLATTSYFGEGIDFPHLNTIIFATPISYYGRLIQYLGRIGRGKQKCLAIDFLDGKNNMLRSVYNKRLEGYRQMHYKEVKIG